MNYTEENSHLCPESLPQGAGIGETELPLEPDEQPAEAKIQVARFLERGNHTGQGDLSQRITIRNLGKRKIQDVKEAGPLLFAGRTFGPNIEK